jgi:multiple sugar transport system substrate-binding protein
MNPVEEAGKMRNVILKDFPGKVSFRPNDNSHILGQVSSIFSDDPNASVLVGALHGDLAILRERSSLRPLDDLYAKLKDRQFAADIEKLSLFGGSEHYYIPWMQASFVMAANKKALKYLPKGSRLEDLTYEEFYHWVKAINQATGKKMFGLPAGQKGLMHRFLEGYLYPSYTSSTLLRFRIRDALALWSYLKRLWSLASQGSLVYSTMAEPLLRDEVWIAWDHTARLVKAFQERPGDFVAFPAPSGPKGRGYMSVMSGLAIPKAVKTPENPAALIEYLTLPAIQERTLRETGFFPVVGQASTSNAPEHLRELWSAVKAQTDSPNGIATLLPVGLGERAGDYDSIFMLAFSRIVLEGADIQTVLDREAAELQLIITERNLACWPPDSSSERPCKIE